MYKCYWCKCKFDKPDVVEEDTGGYQTGVGYYPYIEKFDCCPYCGSEDFDTNEEE